MDNFKLITPIVFIIFNRPDTTQRVFEAIRQAKPPKLLVIADGPRADRVDEVEKCAQARVIIEQVDWDCDVLTNYSEVNLGCKRRVSSGLDWAFNTVEEAIILEDDCLPHPTFFRFCQELLEKYRNDERIMIISGDNFQLGNKRTEYSYYFSKYNHIWGWASWHRAWKCYDVKMNLWPEVKKEKWLKDILKDNYEVAYWDTVFSKVYAGEIDTWDYQWTFACWIQSGLAILPNVNLISNIGFGADSTHTIDRNSPFANLQTEEMKFPLLNPNFIIHDTISDDITTKRMFIGSFFRRFVNKLKAIYK